MASLKDNETKLQVLELNGRDLTRQAIANIVDIPVSTVKDFLDKRTYKQWWDNYGPHEGKIDISNLLEGKGPKILTLDIETAPIQAGVWGLWQQNVGLNMIENDWYILSWCAKWYHETEVMYMDKRDSWNTEDDKDILIAIHKLLDEADIIITQNGKKFDEKKLNARFVLNGMKPPSKCRHIDTCLVARRHFGFTSNKLEYMTDKLCKTYKKLKHGRFPGFELWKECLSGNMEAWQEMEEYNIHDVLSLEELYDILRPWMNNHPNVNVYYDDNKFRCSCGSEELEHSGYAYTNLSKFDRFTCQDCGTEVRGRVNLLPKEKQETLKSNIM